MRIKECQCSQTEWMHHEKDADLIRVLSSEGEIYLKLFMQTIRIGDPFPL